MSGFLFSVTNHGKNPFLLFAKHGGWDGAREKRCLFSKKLSIHWSSSQELWMQCAYNLCFTESSTQDHAPLESKVY